MCMLQVLVQIFVCSWNKACTKCYLRLQYDHSNGVRFNNIGVNSLKMATVGNCLGEKLIAKHAKHLNVDFLVLTVFVINSSATVTTILLSSYSHLQINQSARMVTAYQATMFHNHLSGYNVSQPHIRLQCVTTTYQATVSQPPIKPQCHNHPSSYSMSQPPIRL